MEAKINVGICGYGNLGRGVQKALEKSKDMKLDVIFTRRNPKKIEKESNITACSIDEVEKWKEKLDVIIMCGGSAKDLPIQVPMFAKYFNTVDSFDTHADIPEYFEKVNKSANLGNNVSIISVGWDPGMFSINRLYADSILPEGNTYTFWGKGVSQGHSDAIRKIEGVKDARQYTIPIESAMNRVRRGENPELSIREKHLRECFVVAEDNVDLKRIEDEIKNMPKYFSDYDTIVHFIGEEELLKNHSEMPHGGNVIHIGETGKNHKHLVEYSVKLDSNPEFTGSILVAYARAAYRMSKNGEKGAKTIFDIAPNLLSQKSKQDILGML